MSSVSAPLMTSATGQPIPQTGRPLVLLLPGLSGNNNQWDRVVPMLGSSDSVDVAFGSPILAHAAFAGSRPTVVSLARAMAEELTACRPGPTVIVSHSVGAFVALAMARELGDGVRAVVTVNGGLTTVAKFIDQPFRQLLLHPRECLGFLRLFALVAAPVPQAAKRAIASRRWSSRMVVGRLVSPEALKSDDQRRSLIENAGRFETLHSLRENRHHWREFESYASDIEAECVFIVGDRDPMTTIADTAEMASKLPHARIEVLRGVGHAAPLEAPRAVVDAVQRELR